MRRKKQYNESFKTKGCDGWRRLGDFPTGSRVLVHRQRDSRGLTNRLAAMGISLGSELVVVQNYSRGPIIIEMHDTHIALGRGEAAHIKVEAIDE